MYRYIHNKAMTSLCNHVRGKRDYQITGKGIKKISQHKTWTLECAAVETLRNKFQTTFQMFQKHYVSISNSPHRMPHTPMWSLSSSIMHQKYLITIVSIFCQLWQ